MALGVMMAAAAGAGFWAAGGGLRSGASPRSSLTHLSVTIPGVVGIDIETDLAWDFSSYPAGTIASQSPNNLFPPPPLSTAAAYWTPTSATTTSGAPAPPTWSPPSGNTGAAAIWMALFCNIPGGANVLQLKASLGSWQGGSPFGGADAAVLQIQRDSANNPEGVGPRFWTNLTSGKAQTLPKGNLAKSFPWTRADQLFQLYTAKVSACTFNSGNYTNVVTITLSK